MARTPALPLMALCLACLCGLDAQAVNGTTTVGRFNTTSDTPLVYSTCLVTGGFGSSKTYAACLFLANLVQLKLQELLGFYSFQCYFAVFQYYFTTYQYYFAAYQYYFTAYQYYFATFQYYYSIFQCYHSSYYYRYECYCDSCTFST
ncbi:hypothetical protein Q9233_004055 [Columba guinea]|nr:hypothetical protein Q9233_004055 [Columba guinea]